MSEKEKKQIQPQERRVEIPEDEISRYVVHGLALVNVPINLGSLIMAIDMSSFPRARHAWIKGMKEDGLQVLISKGKQKPPEPTEITENWRIELNEEVREIVVRVYYPHHGWNKCPSYKPQLIPVYKNS